MPKKKKAPRKKTGARPQSRRRSVQILGEHEHPLPHPFLIDDRPESVFLRHVGSALAGCNECSSQTRAEMATATPAQVKVAVAGLIMIRYAALRYNDDPERVAALTRELLPPDVNLLCSAEEDERLDDVIAAMSADRLSAALRVMAESAVGILAGSTGAWNSRADYERVINTPLHLPG